MNFIGAEVIAKIYPENKIGVIIKVESNINNNSSKLITIRSPLSR